jgi:hypothetical protein
VASAVLPIVEAAALVVVAPLWGVRLGSTHLRGLVSSLAVFGALLASSAIGALVMTGLSADAVARVAAAHATLAVAGLALGALGAWSGTALRDPLDAAAVSVAAASCASLGLLAAGPAGADLPTALINAGLAASPIVATAAAGGVDILRSDWFYRTSPLAHGRFDYLSWSVTLPAYGAVLLFSAAAAARAVRRRPASSESRAIEDARH